MAEKLKTCFDVRCRLNPRGCAALRAEQVAVGNINRLDHDTEQEEYSAKISGDNEAIARPTWLLAIDLPGDSLNAQRIGSPGTRHAMSVQMPQQTNGAISGATTS